MRQETADLLLYGSLGLALLSVLHYLLTGVYQLVAGPLHKFKGPWSWIVFPILRHISILKGVENEIVLDLHKKYGPVVRVAPDEVSFTSAAAWQDIYGFGHKQLEKSIYFHARDGLPEHMISAHSSDHSRYRKAVSSAFSEKAIRKQEILISGYVRLFMQRMEALSHGSDQVDMVKWFHLLTFDLIGDLAYGESFGGLKDSVEHSYVSTMFQFVKAGSWLRVFHFYPLLESMALRLTPPKLAQAFHDQWAFTKQVTLRRLNNHDQQGRGDFMDSMVEQHNQPGGLNDMEIVVNSNILLSAGAETSATTLAGVVYFLTRAPSTLAKVQHEVRSAFESQDEINFITSTSKVPFMVACISETMRMYPPVPGTLPRVTNPGGPTIISDAEVPPNTVVGINHYAAYHDPTNFYEADTFHPERWLPEVYQKPDSPFYHDSRASFQPFSVGPRNCIGRTLAYSETRTILAKLLYSFDLELCGESRNWADQKAWNWWDKPALWCKVHARREK